MGLEPTTYGTTIRRSNLLSYIHHIRLLHWKQRANLTLFSINTKFRPFFAAKKIRFTEPTNISRPLKVSYIVTISYPYSIKS